MKTISVTLKSNKRLSLVASVLAFIAILMLMDCSTIQVIISFVALAINAKAYIAYKKYAILKQEKQDRAGIGALTILFAFAAMGYMMLALV